jgi:8-oxo-dGTP pyrophosphatase MutT (NUDIX family)
VSTPTPEVIVPRDAATVMLLRDSEAGLEVFMMRRTLNAVFVGGFYVFPGGAVDAADRSADVEGSCIGLTDADASEQLSIGSGGLAFWVAAVRECFEEAGVLLAAGPDGVLVDFADDAIEARFEGYRSAVHSGERRLIDICADEGLRLAVGDIEYVSHWITPPGEPRRFDTRFFVAHAPVGQRPLHDDNETIASLWVRPLDALERQKAGELQMISPTITHLEYLAAFATADEAMADAAKIRHPATVEPQLLPKADGVDVLMPGDPGYDKIGRGSVG